MVKKVGILTIALVSLSSFAVLATTTETTAAKSTAKEAVKKAEKGKPDSGHGATGAWKATAQLGAVFNTGNTDAQSFNAKLTGTYKRNHWTDTGTITGQYNRSEKDGVTAQQLEAYAQTQYNFTAKNYIYVNTDYMNDRFDGFVYKVNVSTGYGRRIIDDTDKKLFLDIQGGPGYRHQPPEPSLSAKKIKTNVPTANFQLDFGWKITDKTTLTQKASVSYATDNTITQSETALTTALIEKLGLQLSVKITHNSVVPAGTKNTDTISSINLVYAFAND